MNAPCLTCKYAKKWRRHPDGTWAYQCTWTPPFAVAETWNREHITTTVLYAEENDVMLFKEGNCAFRTCGAWEEKEAAE